MSNWVFYNSKLKYRDEYDDLNTPWAGHTSFAYDLVRNLNPGVIVELGTHKGTSFYSMLEALRDIKSNNAAYAVDSWQGDEHAGTSESGYNPEEVYSFVTSMVRKYYAEQNVHLVRKFFSEAAKDFEKGSINLLHIDGLHTYEAVKEDYETWSPKLAKDSVVLFHDIGVADFGVNKLWNAINKDFDYVFEFRHSYGLGVGIKGKKFTDILKSATECPDLVREYYNSVFLQNYSEAKLHATEKAMMEVEKRLPEILHLRDEIKNHAEENSVLKRQIAILQKRSDDSEELYTSAKRQLDQLASRKLVRIYRKVMRTMGRDI
ncbi:MAG: class I SAM-dependent methyltransferase [Candidatus Dojkabacteria bacterium]|nr:MAG: class I SAM-dependent methyltransferase [Candidatus Dojkabacteria bacterium]